MATGARADMAAAVRRKARPARSVPAGPAEADGPRALRRALARAAEAECGLPLGVVGVRACEASLAEVLERLEPASLLAVLEGPGEALGVCALGPQTLAALIEQQTTGAVLSAPAPARRPTRTDAAMVGGLVDRALAELEAGLTGTPDLGWAAGYRYASFLDDARPLGLLLEDVPYRVLAATVDLAGGARRCGVLLALPARPGGRVPAVPGRSEAGAAGDDRAAWSARMERAVLASPVALCAILVRLRLPLASVLDWKSGDFVSLPAATLEDVALEAPGGRVLARARLGQSRGQRALRLHQPPAADADALAAPGGLTGLPGPAAP